jgi:hypothetical protein
VTLVTRDSPLKSEEPLYLVAGGGFEPPTFGL